MKNILFFKKMGIAIVLTSILISVPLATNAATLYRQLQFGMSGSDVRDLQTFLARDRTIYPQGLVTGYFGILTKAAVMNFQARNGISTVGRVGPITLAAINAQMGVGGGGVVPAENMPVITAVGVVSVSGTQATVTWNTSENSSARIYYSASPIVMTEATDFAPMTISGTSVAVHDDLRTSHSATLTGLSPNTTYYYVLYMRDGQGNETIRLPATFVTTN